MNTKEVKKTINKKIQVAKKVAKEKGDELEKIAVSEYAKIKKEMDETAKKVEGYIKNNPGKATLISAGIGAALGTAMALLISTGGKKKK